MRVGATAKIENVELRVDEILAEGERVVSLAEDIDIYMHGSMPIPPYVRRESDSTDVERYQTVFAKGRARWPRRRLVFISQPSC